MIHIYYLNVDDLQDAAIRERFLPQLSEYRQKKVQAMRFPEGKAESLGVGLLLDHALRRWRVADEDTLQSVSAGGRGTLQDVPAGGRGTLLCEKMMTIALGEQGKPFFRDHPGIHFSLSHTKHWVMAAVSDHPVGCDIETIDRHDDDRKPSRTSSCKPQRIAERFFSPQENSWFLSFPEGNRSTAFTRIWTMKEAVIKLSGNGLSEGLSGFTVDPDKLTVSRASSGQSISLWGSAPVPGCLASAAWHETGTPETITETIVSHEELSAGHYR